MLQLSTQPSISCRVRSLLIVGGFPGAFDRWPTAFSAWELRYHPQFQFNDFAVDRDLFCKADGRKQWDPGPPVMLLMTCCTGHSFLGPIPAQPGGFPGTFDRWPTAFSAWELRYHLQFQFNDFAVDSCKADGRKQWDPGPPVIYIYIYIYIYFCLKNSCCLLGSFVLFISYV